MTGWNNSTRPGSTRQSRTMRARVLREEPTCRVDDCDEPSTEDDHIIGWSQRERHGLTTSQWHARSNHQALCSTHHAEKTRRESAVARVSEQRKRPKGKHPSDLT